MTLNDLKLLLGPTNAVAFRAYLSSTLGKTDNGTTYSEEHLNKFVYTTLSDPDPKKSHFKNKK